MPRLQKKLAARSPVNLLFIRRISVNLGGVPRLSVECTAMWSDTSKGIDVLKAFGASDKNEAQADVHIEVPPHSQFFKESRVRASSES